MMQDLRLVLIIMGGVAIAALLLHGLWASKKEQPSKFKDNPLKKLEMESDVDVKGTQKEDMSNTSVAQPAKEKKVKVEPVKEPNLNMDFAEPADDDDIPSMSATDDGITNSTHSFDENVDLSISIEQAEMKANFEKQKEAALKAKEKKPEPKEEPSKDDVAAAGDADTKKADDGNKKATEVKDKVEAVEAKVEEPQEVKENISDASEKEKAEPEELVIVLHVHAPKDETFVGNKLFNSMEQNGLRFGEMSIYHRYADLLDDKKVLFSVANSVNPGTFNLNNIDFSTPSISFFLALPCYGEAEQNFKLMLQTAQKIAGDLGGTVQDQERKMITPQKINEYRIKVKNFQQK